MKIIHYSNEESTYINNDVAKEITGRVVIGKKDGAENFCMRVFEIAENGYTPKHKHDWEHEIFFHKGEGLVYKNGEWVAVKTGSVAFIKGNEEHQIKNTGKTPLVFICLVPKSAPEM